MNRASIWIVMLLSVASGGEQPTCPEGQEWGSPTAGCVDIERRSSPAENSSSMDLNAAENSRPNEPPTKEQVSAGGPGNSIVQGVPKCVTRLYVKAGGDDGASVVQNPVGGGCSGCGGCAKPVVTPRVVLFVKGDALRLLDKYASRVRLEGRTVDFEHLRILFRDANNEQQVWESGKEVRHSFVTAFSGKTFEYLWRKKLDKVVVRDWENPNEEAVKLQADVVCGGD